MIIFQKPVKTADQAALTRFARRAQKLAGVSGEVSILIAGNLQLRALNLRFRKKDKPTDVLSFPSPGGTGGDIAISPDIAKQNTAPYGPHALYVLNVLVLKRMPHLPASDHHTTT